MNKSEAIREFYKKNSNLGLTAIAKALTAQGIACTAPHVQQAIKKLRVSGVSDGAESKPQKIGKVERVSKPAAVKPTAVKPAAVKSQGVSAAKVPQAKVSQAKAAQAKAALVKPAHLKPAASPVKAVRRAKATPVAASGSTSVVRAIELAKEFTAAAGGTAGAIQILNSLS